VSNAKQTNTVIGILPETRILICRPEPAASELANVLSSVGAECQTLPTISIEPLELLPSERQKILDLDQYKHIIVVSQHAARIGLEYIDEFWPQAPAEQHWYAIGRKTASILRPEQINLIEPERDLTSEKLLESKPLANITGEKVLILKGKEGRNTLQKGLTERGASVDTISLYSRSCPNYSVQEVKDRIETFKPNYIIALSGETLLNLISICQKSEIDIRYEEFILSSQRVMNIAYEHGLKRAYIPTNLMPIDIIRCIAKAKKNNQLN
jgi:uroporphyrinogen-III synthase